MALTDNDLPKLVELLNKIDIRMQQRGKTAAQWTADNGVLKNRELGLETDTGKAKIGDGITAWADLRYWAGLPITAASTPAADQVLNYNDVTHELRWVDNGKTYQAGTGIEIANPTSATPTISSTLGSIALSGRKEDYAHLPTGLGPTDAGQAYLVESDGLIYVWDGNAWPAEGGGVAGGGSGQLRLIHKWDHAVDGTQSGELVVDISGLVEVVAVCESVPISTSGYRLAQLSFDGGATYLTTGYCLMEANGTLQEEHQLLFHSTSSASARSGVIHISIPEGADVLPISESSRVNVTPIGYILNSHAPTAPTHIRIYASGDWIGGRMFVYGR